jgi:hypothetical protein
MLTFPFALALAMTVIAGPAAAQTVYKCSEDGTTVYADHPCERGPSRTLPPPVGVDPDIGAVHTGDSRTLVETDKLRAQLQAGREQERREKLSAKLQAQRERREREERREARGHVRVQKADAAHYKRCERLRLAVKWAQEDLAQAGARKQEAARTRLRRRQEAMAVECRG